MQDKIYILLAGVNGAGKSTFYSVAAHFGKIFPFCDGDVFQKLPLVNSDKFAKKLGDWKDSAVQREAAQIAVEMIKNCFARGVSFSQETTLSGRAVLRNINTAKKLGYKVGIIYIGVDSVDIAKERVRYRVENGGHGIPENLIETRYSSSFNNLNKIMSKCDGVYLLDNSSDKKLRAIAIYDGEKLNLKGDYVGLPNWVEKYIEVPIFNETKEHPSSKEDSFEHDEYE